MPEALTQQSDPAVCRAVAAILLDAGWDVTPAATQAQGLDLLRRREMDLLVTDDPDFVRRCLGLRPMMAALVVAQRDEEAEAVSAFEAGAVGCIALPVVSSAVLDQVRRVVDLRALGTSLEAALAVPPPEQVCLTGRSSSVVQLCDRVRMVAASDAPVLVTGESGTGKEVVARSLHEQSARRRGPFVAVNCAAFPETLLEAELFGHERGAFTGAVGRRAGRFKAAEGGTLFLDEIAEIPLTAQVKLLRVLQDHTIEPLGSDTSIRVDVRIISATHRDLKQRIADGSFRADLYYRLNVLDVSIPPLRERLEDLPLLIGTLVRRFMVPGGPPVRITPRAWVALRAHPFPGNVRELEHALQHATVLAQGAPIDFVHLPSDIVGELPLVTLGSETLRPLADFLREQERDYLLRVLRHVQGHRSRAAAILGISRKNLWEKLRSHQVDASSITGDTAR